MIYADDAFIDKLETISKLGQSLANASAIDLRRDNPGAGLIDRGDGFIDIAVLSDIHLNARVGDAGSVDLFEPARRTFPSQLDEFKDRYAELKNKLDGERPRDVDLVIQCGDLVEGWAAGKWCGEPQSPETVYNALFGGLVSNALESVRTTGEGDAKRTVPFLCVPGNHDLYRGGALVPLNAEQEVPRRGLQASQDSGRLKAHFFYDQVARRFVGKPNELPHDWLTRVDSSHPMMLPALNLSVVYKGDKTQEKLASYLAVIGLDSNFAEYCNDGAENHGQISKQQISQAEKLIRALAKSCGDAPLHIIAVVHHHLLPTENKRLSQTREDGRVELRKKKLECQAEHKRILGRCPVPEVSEQCVDKWLAAEASTSSLLNGSRLIEFCHEHRVSALLHGHMHQEQVLWVGRQSFSNRKFEETLAVIACPSFKRGGSVAGEKNAIEGIVALRLRPDENVIEVAYSGNKPTEDSDEPVEIRSAMQVRAPLLSASRISNGERRLFDRVTELLDKEIAKNQPADSRRLMDYRDRVRFFFQCYGFTVVSPQICGITSSGEPGELQVIPDIFKDIHQHKKYSFLLLLRQRDGVFEILLSKHTPQRESRIGDWNTLLMPAFNKVGDFLERLRNDVARQHQNAISVRTAASADKISARIDKLLRDSEESPDGPWQDEAIPLLEPKPFVKVSPTDGTVTCYDYGLVSLRPFTEGISGDGVDESELSEAIGELPRIVLSLGATGEEAKEVKQQEPRIWIGALRDGGSALRWEGPQGTLSEERLAHTKVPNGLVWFPIVDEVGNGLAGGWRTCPSLVARNADVLAWIENYVGDYVRARECPGGYVGPRLELATPADISVPVRVRSADSRPLTIIRQMPFDGPTQRLLDEPAKAPISALAGPTSSLTEAMRNVCYDPGRDIGAWDPRKKYSWPYRDNPIRRVLLIKEPMGRMQRMGIAVYSADHLREEGWPSRRNAQSKSLIQEKYRLGVLRPVQRYVTRSGVIRAHEVNRRALDKMWPAWGYVHATPRQGGNEIAITPPIIEEMHPKEYEGDVDDNPQAPHKEFIICDGNHRVIEQVWGLRPAGAQQEAEPNWNSLARSSLKQCDEDKLDECFVMCAVAVMGTPKEPYYANAFSKFEWNITAQNQYEFPPDLHAKYSVRSVDVEKERIPKSDLIYKDIHRRYYRRLDLGFGNLGGQAGKG